MRFTFVVLFGCVVNSVRADDKDELKKLDGAWDVVGMEAGGKEAPKGKGAVEKLTIKDGKLTGFGPEIRLSTDATKKPKWLNMTFSIEGMDVTINAIYELNGDELKICLPLAPKKGSGAVFENKRPEGFDTKDKPEMLIKAKKAK
jgi:uncharacterized protein (TIGR03067 family)